MSVWFSILPWQKPCAENLVDRGLYFLTINGKLIAGVFVWHAKPAKFYWDGLAVSIGEVGLCLSKIDLEATIPDPSTCDDRFQAWDIGLSDEQVAA